MEGHAGRYLREEVKEREEVQAEGEARLAKRLEEGFGP